jgi:putative salt-induced outer membrane protein
MRNLFIIIFSMLPLMVFAESVEVLPGQAVWKSEVELGFVFTSGNSETESSNGRVSVLRELHKWRQSLLLEGLSASNTDRLTNVETTTAERYTANLKADYKVTEANFLFANALYNDDRFSGFEYQATLSTGYGRHILKTEKQSLEAEIGPGIRLFKLNPDPVTGAHIPSDDENILHMAASYVYNFTDYSAFQQDVVVDAGDDTTISQSVTAIRTRINSKLAMKASMKIRNSSSVPANTEKTDRESALTLVYTF